MFCDDEWTEDLKRGAAVEIAVAVGLLRRCPVHAELCATGVDRHVNAFKLANYRISNDSHVGQLFPGKGGRRELTDLVQGVAADSGSRCPLCAKQFEE